MEEEFVPIPGFEGYQISRDGVIRSCKLRKMIMKSHINRYGYVGIELQKNGERYGTTVHRLLALTFISNPLNYEEVNHIDGNKLNNSISNLEWVTKSMNSLHRHRVLGKTPPGIECIIEKDGEQHLFKTKSEAIRFIQCHPQTFYTAHKKGDSVKGWTIK